VRELVQSVDIFPTVLELVGLERAEVSRQLTGLDLRPDRLALNPRPFAVSERLAPSLKRFERTLPDFDTSAINRQLRALRLRGSGEKVIWGSDGRHEVYDLIADPYESLNLAGRDPERLQILLGLHQSWLDGLELASLGKLEQAIEGELAERLQDLGYL
jgi:arylsulfatase A-like enzyme